MLSLVEQLQQFKFTYVFGHSSVKDLLQSILQYIKHIILNAI